jgi:beta-glucosidase/6-phospho-beta-glucosidase/beta-galactosidase
MGVAKGIVRTVRALKQVDPTALMVHVEAVGLTRAAREELEPLAAEHRRRGFVFYDLITGRIDSGHPLYTWLLTNGVRADDLRRLHDERIDLDIVGLNFYPEWSTKQLATNTRGALHWQLVERDGAGFADLIADYYEQYRVPIMITETSAKRSLATKRQWLDASLAAVRRLRQQGVPVIGYTWFPLFTMIDWKYRTGDKHRNEYLIELGLYESQVEPDTSLRYVPTPLVEVFRGYTRQPELVAGDLQTVGDPAASISYSIVGDDHQ